MFKSMLRTGIALLVLLVGAGPVHAEDVVRAQSPRLATSSATQLLKGRSATEFHQKLDMSATPIASAQQSSGGACLCTNLNAVSVVCEACDLETHVENCYLHDNACQDAALKGGIREFDSFFCTSVSE
ncbi:MAG: hypothetical protein KDK91_32405 [Gammaproteobacteria bacterium]|nr:hypothetical protein [Gammaproteobacteria bacterium]